MSTNVREPLNASIEITDFFLGGRKKRDEMLAQPECGCSDCSSDCSCQR